MFHEALTLVYLEKNRVNHVIGVINLPLAFVLYKLSCSIFVSCGLVRCLSSCWLILLQDDELVVILYFDRAQVIDVD